MAKRKKRGTKKPKAFKDKGMLMGSKGQRVPFGEEVQERNAKISMITRQVDTN